MQKALVLASAAEMELLFIRDYFGDHKKQRITRHAVYDRLGTS